MGVPAPAEDLLRARVVLQTDDGNLVDGVERLDVVRRRKDGDGHQPVGVDAGSDERLVQRELVGALADDDDVRCETILSCSSDDSHPRRTSASDHIDYPWAIPSVMEIDLATADPDP